MCKVSPLIPPTPPQAWMPWVYNVTVNSTSHRHAVCVAALCREGSKIPAERIPTLKRWLAQSLLCSPVLTLLFHSLQLPHLGQCGLLTDFLKMLKQHLHFLQMLCCSTKTTRAQERCSVPVSPMARRPALRTAYPMGNAAFSAQVIAATF
jgi:hypothetical protein